MVSIRLKATRNNLRIASSASSAALDASEANGASTEEAAEASQEAVDASLASQGQQSVDQHPTMTDPGLSAVTEKRLRL